MRSRIFLFCPDILHMRGGGNVKRQWIWWILAVCAAAGMFAAAVFASDRQAGDVLALMYHDLAEDGADPSVLSPWRTTPTFLRQDLRVLMEAGYAPLSVEAYAAREYDPRRDYFIVTFDDGYISNLTLAEPVLREMGVPASVFVITSMVGAAGHMTWEELHLLESGGVFTVYSHTHTHLRADSVPAEAFLQEAGIAGGARVSCMPDSVQFSPRRVYKGKPGRPDGRGMQSFAFAGECTGRGRKRAYSGAHERGAGCGI